MGEPDAGRVPTTPLRIGGLTLDPPLVLAPMAGVTSYPFRAICRRLGAALCISEMVTARPLAEGRAATLRLAAFGPGESPRSLQLLGYEPGWVGEAVRRVVGEQAIDHLDLNFGCPVRKVTRRGGGAATAADPRRLRALISAAVGAAGVVPVTVKLRIGIDERRTTFLEAGRIAADEGCAALILHARTAAQLYDGAARWEAIATLKRALEIPVLGNGDVFTAADGLRMLRETGCDGIVVGRGCLGRPWLFRDLADALAGRAPSPPPTFGKVAATMLEHARGLVDWFGEERPAMLAFRKHAGWYTRGFRGSARLRERLMGVTTVSALAEILAGVDRDEPYPEVAARVRRGKRSGVQRVALPPELAGDQAPCRGRGTNG